MTDAELLAEYLATRSERAFAQLVDRHVDLVYACARRQVADPGAAQDVTQAVFIVLARRAAAVRCRGSLAGWLVTATGYVAKNALRLRARRQKHEHEAAAMNPIATDARSVEADVDAEQVAHLLDGALGRLREADRSAVVLRFLEGKSLREVGMEMGISEDAARKRVDRAVSRMRSAFARHGVHSPEDALAPRLFARSLHAAPAGLAALSVAGALGAGAPASSTAATLATLTTKTMTGWTAQGIAATVALTAALAGGTLVLVNLPSTPSTRAAATPTSQSSTSTPDATATASSNTDALVAPASGALKLDNTMFVDQSTPNQYESNLDAGTLRAGPPTGHLKSLLPRPKAGARSLHVPAQAFRGQRIRLTGWIKTNAVANWAAIQLSLYNDAGRLLSNDDMGDRPITGTTDWRQYQSVADVPDDADTIAVSTFITGAGEMWTDDFQVETVPKSVPLTDDQLWRKWSPVSPLYTAALDPNVQRNGHPTLCLASASAPPGSFAVWNKNDRVPDTLIGHRIKVTAWLKSEGVTGDAGPWVIVRSNWTTLTTDGQIGHRPIHRTTDWKQYTSIATVPEGATSVISGAVLNGRGKLWIDDIRYESGSTF